MDFRAICVALLLSCLPIAGCGTAANLVRSQPGEGGKTPFGGVKHDLWCIKKASSGEFGDRTQPKSEPEQYPQVALTLLCAADLPFSFIGDVLTWPYTAAYTFINEPVPAPSVLPPQQIPVQTGMPPRTTSAQPWLPTQPTPNQPGMLPQPTPNQPGAPAQPGTPPQPTPNQPGTPPQPTPNQLGMLPQSTPNQPGALLPPIFAVPGAQPPAEGQPQTPQSEPLPRPTTQP